MDTAPSTLQNGPERELVTWTAPSRPFKRRDRKFFVTTFAMAGIVSLILFLAEGIMPVLLIIALVFLYYVLSTVEPEKIEYKVTNKGIKITGHLTPWNSLARFWFTKKLDNESLIFESFGIPGRVELVINTEDKGKLKEEISAYIPYEEVPVSRVEKVTNWLTSRMHP